jgi:hypothetical protein
MPALSIAINNIAITYLMPVSPHIEEPGWLAPPPRSTLSAVICRMRTTALAGPDPKHRCGAAAATKETLQTTQSIFPDAR